MGCINSKRASSPPPVYDSSFRASHSSAGSGSGSSRYHNGSSGGHFDPVLLKRAAGFGELEKIKEEPEKENDDESADSCISDLKKFKSIKKAKDEKKAVFSLRFGRYTEAAQIAAGWPPWLSAVAGEAVEGWLPLKADLFEKLDKIGQGTYSSVYRARNVETGQIIALKKVRFDTFQPESVRFMAREIAILRRLDHPNIMKLEGLITNRFSCSIYLVFEYMEHDLSGLLSCPDIKFSDAQIKCYMRQLLAGLEHCHSRGVMHRDIKTSNILVNNEGVLKIADFGLANYISSRHRQPLTSRVVTLWYRPPELLLGSTNYGPSVDLWSVGCVFAELFIGKPILKGRTEVEQLHKIFKLCGSPPDEFWKNSKLPLATMFKPQYPYLSSLREKCKEFPKSAVNLLETFLSIEPHNRGTTSSALDSEYFATKPYACDPSSLPKYPPNKEFDAKIRDEVRRRRADAKARASGRNPKRSRKALQEPISISKEVESSQYGRRSNGGKAHILKGKGATEHRGSLQTPYDTVSEVSEASQVTEISQVDSIKSVPAVTGSSDFAWVRKRNRNAGPVRLYSEASSRGQNLRAMDPSSTLHSRHAFDPEEEQENEEFSGHDSIEPYSTARRAMRRQRSQTYRADSFDSAELYQSQELPLDYKNGRVQLSGPLLSQSGRLDEAPGPEDHVRQGGRRSRFYRG
ncbi:cyclin-dependent kinase C-2 C-like [Diospyros lotus]|uniref:cyclin-dependent kinase C-2 C-like n=1 Tax=Diospyros lotus TaxID=55363 RepID=UPI00225BCD8E|nr:cyclin-dependent kinase C-2 C-like [Diospyros lotus]